MDKSDLDFINNNTNNMSFLPEDYKEPVTSNYMKFEKGENKFRVLSSAIVGMEYWKEVDGKRKPIRLKQGVPAPLADLETDKDGNLIMPKHFWAFSVWNYNVKAVQILEITQSTIRKAMKKLLKMKDWGIPQGYDVTVTREGDGFDTEYTTLPSNKSKTDEGKVKLYEDMNIDLEQLFSGNDPFKTD